MKKGLISIIIPFKNRIDLVNEALASVYKQTYTQFEIILIDDGSTESSENLKLNQNFRHQLIHQENQGPSKARNRGIQVAEGEYIAFLDSDDLYHPEKLERQIQALEQNPNYALVHTSYMQFRQDLLHPIKTVDTSFNKEHAFPKIIFRCLIATPSVFIRSSVMKQYQFDENMRISEDTVLWIRLAEKYKILHMPDVLTYVRIHGANAAFDYKKRFEIQKTVLKALKKHQVKIPFFYSTYRLVKTYLMSLFGRLKQ